jgi:hypothetical protein
VVLAEPRERVIFSHWSRVSPSNGTLPSSPGLPFSDQIAPVIEALARNREICFRRRAPPCPSMAGFSGSFMSILPFTPQRDPWPKDRRRRFH